MGEFLIPRADLWRLLPELVLAAGGTLVLLLDAFAPRLRRVIGPAAMATTLAALYACWVYTPDGPSFGGFLDGGPLTAMVSMIVLLVTLLCQLASEGYLLRERLGAGEYHALLLWCAAGALLMGRSAELVTLFVALELLSICLYSLAGYHRRLAIATEGAIKYFLMGAFVSAFILLGIALLYGETGTTRLTEIATSLDAAGGQSPLAILGLLLLVAGFGFKMSVAPFHAWAPDTYQGAPSPFVAFLSVAPKVAAALVLLRVLSAASFVGLAPKFAEAVALIAVLSMVVGNLLALVQRDIKRMLAYSGVAHMGYALVPLVGVTQTSYEPLMVYLFAYALMNAGAFVVVSLLYSEAGEQHLITDLSGWGYRYPLLGLCLTVAMLSLGGIPPTFGFIGKYMVFAHAIEHGQLWLAIAIVATSVIGVYYYLRVVYTLYMRPLVREPRADAAPDLWGEAAAVVATTATLLMGVWPTRLLDWLDGVGKRFL